MEASPSDARRDELAEAVDDAERAISRAMNAFPDEAELLRSEARLQDLLGDGDTAIQSLEKAWTKMARGAGVAKQLARRYLARNEVDPALATLNTALERQPTDRSLNLMIANILFLQSGDLNDRKAVDRNHPA